MDIDVICKLRNNIHFTKKKGEKPSLEAFYQKNKYEYAFDHIWDDDTSFDDITDYLYNESKSYRDRHIVVFGYSGSGKSYTITNILKNILQDLESNKFTISCFQIYNNKIYDLFNNNKPLLFYKNKELLIKNNTKLNSKPFEYVNTVIQQNRKINKTSCNDTSSRSCMIITIQTLRGNTTIIDMPGQEVANIYNQQNVHNEAKNINLSLLALKQCITNYYEKKNHIPFRNSLLTLYLKKMFYSVCRVFFICNVYGKHQLFHQIDSMKYVSFLRNNKKKSGVNYQKLLLEYSYYIQNIGLNFCDDNVIFQEIKKKNYKNIHRIHKLVKSNSEYIIAFQKKLENILCKR